MDDAPVVAVTGATGRVGGRAVRRLAERPDVRVVALAREPARMPRIGTVEVRRADYDAPTSLVEALRDVNRLVFVSSDGEADIVLRQHTAVVTAAYDVGVRRVSYLSSLDADPASPFCYARTNGATEELLWDAVADVRVVRAGLFLDFVHALMGDGAEVRVPPGGLVATVARDTVADALADAAVEDGAPRISQVADAPLTWEELAQQRGQRFVPVDLDIYRAELIAAGESPWWCYAYTSMLQSVAEGRFAGGAAQEAG